MRSISGSLGSCPTRRSKWRHELHWPSAPRGKSTSSRSRSWAVPAVARQHLLACCDDQVCVTLFLRIVVGRSEMGI